MRSVKAISAGKMPCIEMKRKCLRMKYVSRRVIHLCCSLGCFPKSSHKQLDGFEALCEARFCQLNFENES